jgi:hypothetical protein
MVEQLIIEESRPEALEEMYFWPIVRDRLPGGITSRTLPPARSRKARQPWISWTS